ncbi:DEAD/DEAH box helicase [Geminicoccus roseus]|uniref:DEAD/DEAH box helicase n=1 Tax=Geminicoccus roseus TaxID=404900 RepID=UPI0006880097|nr:DEAD/DEAH box helicase [Geminicoccus roseus]
MLPWELKEKARPNTQLFYQVILGAVRMDDATEQLLTAFHDEDVERITASGFAPIGILTLDRDGRPVEPDAVAISSFAWGLPIALNRNLAALGRWPEAEAELIELVDKSVRRTGGDGRLLPLDRSMIDQVYQHLVQALALPPDLVAPPAFALRVYQYYKAEEPPDPPPMGSFFLGDLTRAKVLLAADDCPPLLAHYLGMSMPTQRIDLQCDDAELAEAVAPGGIPQGCWPEKQGHPLVLLQQAAINLAFRMDDRTALLPVNGPPGTGKTTLLRDLVAGIIVDRAEVLVEFDDPLTAFTHAGEKFRTGSAFTHAYKIDDCLKGFEIVVASSNNKAVENVSAELPALKQIGRSRTDPCYFRSISDRVARNPRPEGEDDDRPSAESLPSDEETWGLIAAVLGNAANRAAFRRNAWSDPDHGLRTYLLEVCGNPQMIETLDKKTGRIVDRRKPKVVAAEKPPTGEEAARRRWQSARKRFKSAVQAVAQRLREMEQGRQALDSSGLAIRHAAMVQRVVDAEKHYQDAQRQCVSAEANLPGRRLALQDADYALAAHAETEPGFVVALFSSSRADWQRRGDELVAEQSRAASLLQKAQAVLQAARTAEGEARRQVELAKAEAHALDLQINAMAGALQRAEALAGDRFVDAAFLERAANQRADLHRDTAWIDPETLRLRENVFVAAIELHRAFVDAAAKPIRNNLDLLFRSFFGKSAWTPRMKPLMPDLWTTFFTVVPVVSTTFASVERMLGYLPPTSLGWLLIDEAGQAVPQAAVGALLRTKRAVVVGDPIQLPPVTSLPTELAAKVAQSFRIEHHRFVAPAASAQTLADASSMFGTTIKPKDKEPTWVGVPLVVHRRCSEPMFTLSNTIAYGGLMEQGRGEKPSAIRTILGRSRWIDVQPDRCEDKWSAAEGDAVVNLLRQLDQAQLPELDLYIISPFRVVTHRLRELLAREPALRRWTKEPDAWVKQRVGTVYTVQGREADSVIMVLGAAQPERRGARSWAGQSVNQLNVAITRAKENLYVIGHRRVWASAGEFEHLERMI